ncbi:MAG: hypothetical protein K6T85_10840 [Gorillibacterium sp.]|nr:hypothetical protein [Gorillibacterium sp.]
MDYQAFITYITNAFLALAATLIVAGVYKLRDRASAWLEARTTVAQRETLHRTAVEGFAYAETVFRDYGGEEKLQEAIQYLDRRLIELGLIFGSTEIRAAIEQAVLEYNAKVKRIAPLLEGS